MRLLSITFFLFWLAIHLSKYFLRLRVSDLNISKHVHHWTEEKVVKTDEWNKNRYLKIGIKCGGKKRSRHYDYALRMSVPFISYFWFSQILVFNQDKYFLNHECYFNQEVIMFLISRFKLLVTWSPLCYIKRKTFHWHVFCVIYINIFWKIFLQIALFQSIKTITYHWHRFGL